ncbi:BMP family ABC transporter substrate-binding protein [Oscillibacter sp. MSJ-2]|uniref:BMP family ABC transporter substrate-binding protein n=1 Tax=Dysosmobacter acutus TaxID=2841504 RepID=A0ABS6F7W6_9FIRM|nr:BMP family ABC transporter substrate-binding protein [Dysosmobacter acutus]MBU5626143.1 BMP family ABC transporter substrate-binding protein [Dysosmobacter acutus]
MKRMLAFVLAAVLALGMLTGCGSTTDLEAGSKSSAGSSSEGGEAALKVGVVFTTGGLGDNNFNDMVYAGLNAAKEDMGITFDYAEPSSGDEYTTMTYDFAQDGSYDLIIVLSSDGATAVEQVAPEYPDQLFTIVDQEVVGDNICSIVKNGAEQTFLTGVIAGLLTQDSSYEYANADKKVGAVLGMDVATVVAMAAGFACGAKFYDPSVEVLVSTVGDFSDVNTAKEMSLSMYEQGVDVIMNLDGSGTGIWAALEEKQFYGVGCGSNQNTLSPYIVATAGFVLSQIIYDQCKDMIDGTWVSGTVNPTIRDGAFDYLTDDASVQLSDEIIKKVEAARDWYETNSDVVLATTMDTVDAWVAENGQAA